MSSIPGATSKLTPIYPCSPLDNNGNSEESCSTQRIIAALGLERHIEGGYFAEIDRNPLVIPNPFLARNGGEEEEEEKEGEVVNQTAEKPVSGDDSIRNASTSIYYMLSPIAPQGHFHRNKGRTVHTLISGRGRYVLIHADEPGEKKIVESFVVGHDVADGEKSVWIVEGGFEYSDHDFLDVNKFRQLVTEEQAEELEWLVRKS
ncbi:duf985 domain-containing protein [Stemphylium lycopersici]|nr:duf985 domain-containing protein [Stemphylium lycopersici]